MFACLQAVPAIGYSNSGLIDRGGGLVVDTFWDLPHTREMIALYSKVWTAPARRVPRAESIRSWARRNPRR